jgi:hypothetical protein
MGDRAPHVLGSFALSPHEHLRVALTEQSGGAMVDVRIFSDLTVVAGVQTSTGRRLAVSVEAIGCLIDALRAAEREVERRSLAGGDA